MVSSPPPVRPSPCSRRAVERGSTAVAGRLMESSVFYNRAVRRVRCGGGHDRRCPVHDDSTRPSTLTKLSIENVRAFGERQELKLADADGRPAPWTLIVGDNGVGKTTLLQCLARMRPRFNPPPDEPGGPPDEPGKSADERGKARPIEPELAAEEENGVLAALVRSGNQATARLEADLSVGVELVDHGGDLSRCLWTSFSVQRANGDVTDVRASGRVTDVRAGGEAAEEDVEPCVEEPLVLGYGAGRHPTLGTVGDAATGPIESLFKVAAELHDAEEILCQLDYSSLKNGREAARQLDSLKNLIAAVLPDVGDPDNIEILGPPQDDPSRPGGVRVKTPYGRVPLAQVSLGYRTMFAWIVDTGWRLIEHYPDSPHPLHEPAIVLVDEIDLHLHPRRQRTVRKTLVHHFPRVQFIATAHSPLMAQSSLDDNLVVVRQSGDHAEIVNDPTVIKEWRLDQLITSDLFGLDSARSPAVAAMLERRAELLEKPKLTPAEQDELDKLNEEALAMPSEESYEDNEAMEIIRRAADRLRSGQGDAVIDPGDQGLSSPYS